MLQSRVTSDVFDCRLHVRHTSPSDERWSVVDVNYLSNLGFDATIRDYVAHTTCTEYE